MLSPVRIDPCCVVVSNFVRFVIVVVRSLYAFTASLTASDCVFVSATRAFALLS